MITNSFKDKRTEEFIDVYLSNNSMTCNDLLNILPIYNMNNDTWRWTTCQKN